MANEGLDVYKARLAARGLTISGFSGGDLLLTYDATKDSVVRQERRPVGYEELGHFAIVALDEEEQRAGGTREWFPGVRRAVIS